MPSNPSLSATAAVPCLTCSCAFWHVLPTLRLRVSWLFLSERDPLSVLVIDTVLLRKTVYLSPRLGRVIVSLCGVSLGCMCALSAGGQCNTVAVKNAAGGALLALLVPFA